MGKGTVRDSYGPGLDGEALFKSFFHLIKLPVPSVNEVNAAILAEHFHNVELQRVSFDSQKGIMCLDLYGFACVDVT